MNRSNTTIEVRRDARLTAWMALTTLVALSALLTACGGGGGGDSAAAPAVDSTEYVPAAASDGVSVFAGWLKQMSTETMDGREAMNTSTFKPTVQEDTDPVAAPQ
jgi:hypothetical protein